MLRIKILRRLPNTRTNRYGTVSLSFRVSIIWNQIPDQYKAAKTDNIIKMKIKSFKGLKCNYCICI